MEEILQQLNIDGFFQDLLLRWDDHFWPINSVTHKMFYGPCEAGGIIRLALGN